MYDAQHVTFSAVQRTGGACHQPAHRMRDQDDTFAAAHRSGRFLLDLGDAGGQLRASSASVASPVVTTGMHRKHEELVQHLPVLGHQRVQQLVVIADHAAEAVLDWRLKVGFEVVGVEGLADDQGLALRRVLEQQVGQQPTGLGVPAQIGQRAGTALAVGARQPQAAAHDAGHEDDGDRLALHLNDMIFVGDQACLGLVNLVPGQRHRGGSVQALKLRPLSSASLTSS